MAKILDIHGDKSPLQLMFADKVCGKCGDKAMVIQEDGEENQEFFCFKHSPERFKEIWYHGHDK